LERRGDDTARRHVGSFRTLLLVGGAEMQLPQMPMEGRWHLEVFGSLS